MARTDIPVQRLGAWAGADVDVTWTNADSTNDMSFLSNGTEIVLVKNADSGPHTVSVMLAPGDRTFNQSTASKDLTVAAGTIGAAGPFPQAAFLQTGNVVHVDLTTETSLSLAVIGWTP